MTWIEIIKALVRPLIAYSLTIGFLHLTFKGSVSVEAFVGVFGMVIGYYYGQRDGNKKPQ